MWGAATAAYQIEGAWNEDGKSESNWDRWCHTPGKIRGGGVADVAVDHYHRWQEDVELMRQMNLNGYRFSTAWSRVIPDGVGFVNQKGIDFYSRLVDGLLAAGIEPFITLCHYDIPQVLEECGGWVNRDLTDWFAAYAEIMVKHLGDRVTHWMTINEPICISDDHYGGVVEPPGLNDPCARSIVTHHLLLGHGKALATIKQIGGAHHQVGLVCNLYPVQAYLGERVNSAEAGAGARVNFYTGEDGQDTGDFSPEEVQDAIRQMDDRVNRRWLDPIFLGHYPEGLWQTLGHEPAIQPGDTDIIGVRPDFLGVNYYSRIITRPVRKDGSIQANWVSPKEIGIPVTTMGWETYPQGLYELLIKLQKDYHDPVFYITENGMAIDDQLGPDGKVHDDYRIDFLRQHFDQVARCIADGVRLNGYFVWSLMDNFEWEAGWGQRFGLVYVDYQTLTRTVKDSGWWYRNLIRSQRGLPA